MQDPSTTAWVAPMPIPATIDPHRAQQARTRKLLEENAWLNALLISTSDLHALRSIQGLYEGVFLIDPAFTIEQCDPATGFSPSLPVEWMGWAENDGWGREETSCIPSEMRINPWTKTLEGTMSFRATRLPEAENPGRRNVNSVDDIVREWGRRGPPYYELEIIRQTLSPGELRAELRNRDDALAWAREESLNKEVNKNDELALLSACFSVKGDVTIAVFDRSGNSIQIRLRVHTKYNGVWEEFDGDFRTISFVNLQTYNKLSALTKESSIDEAEDSHLVSLLARLLSERKTLSAQVFDKLGNSMPIRLRRDEKVVVFGEFDGDFATLSLMRWKIDSSSGKR